MQTTTGDIPADGVIGIDLACFDCRYNLRTLRVGGQCPECGMEIEETLRKNLIGADPAWLQGVRRGATQLGWAFVVLAIWFGIQLLSALYFPLEPGDVESVVTVICVYVIFIFAIVAAIRFARRDPRVPSEIAVSRLGTIASGGAALGTLSLGMAGIQGFPLGVEGCTLLIAVWILCISWYACRLLRGVPEGRGVWFAFLVVAVTSLTLLGTLWSVVFPRLPPTIMTSVRATSRMLDAMSGVFDLVIPPSVAWLFTAVLLFRLARAISRVGPKAEALRAGFERGTDNTTSLQLDLTSDERPTG